jgi:hypothetical protein
MANAVFEGALQGFGAGDMDYDAHKFQAYLIDAANAGPTAGVWVPTNITFATTTVTVTLPTGHGFVAGDVIAVKNSGLTNVDGNWSVTSVTATTVVFTVTTTPTGTFSAAAVFVFNVSKTFLSEVALAAARVAISGRLTSKTNVKGVFGCAQISWASVSGATSEVVAVVRTATAADTDAQVNDADTAQRLLSYYDSLTGLPLQANPGNVNWTPSPNLCRL